MPLKEMSWKIKYASFRIFQLSIEPAFSLLDQRNLGLFLTFDFVTIFLSLQKYDAKLTFCIDPRNFVRFIVENV